MRRTPRRSRTAAPGVVSPWFVTLRWPVLLLATVGVVLSLFAVRGAHDRLVDGGYLDPGAESSHTERTLNEHYGTGSVNLVLLATADEAADTATATAAGRQLVAELAAEQGVADVRSPWSSGGTGMLSADRHTALLTMRITGDDSGTSRTAARVIRDFTGPRPPFRLEATGRLAVNRYAEEQSRRDLVRTEIIGVPLVATLLLCFFGSLWACLMPLAMGLIAITGAMAVIGALARFTEVSVFSLNLVCALGFGLAVDYSLLTVSRFGEELRAGRSVVEAVRVTSRSAGRTVGASALVVGLSLSALLLFPAPFFRSLGAAAVTVVVLAGATALLLQPVLLAALGHRLARGGPPEGTRGARFWDRLTGVVLRRRLLVVLAVPALLLLLAAPFAGARCGFINDRWLPRDAAPRTTAERAREDFPVLRGATLTVFLPGARTGSPEAAAAGRALSVLRGVDLVSGPSGTYRAGRERSVPVAAPTGRTPGTWYRVTTPAGPYSATAQRLVASVRGRHLPGGPARVSGETAALADMKHSLTTRLPWAALLVTATVATVLFLLTGSVLVPVKALVLNLLSLTASFGAMVVLFQDGLLAHALGGTATGHLDPLVPVLVFCIAFGVSMDYEVFLVARVREEYLATGDNDRSIAGGLRRTGRLVTAAAFILITALATLAASDLVVLQLLGVSMALAVAVDATLIRCALVPAVMSLAGRWNWWAPPPLRAARNAVVTAVNRPSQPPG